VYAFPNDTLYPIYIKSKLMKNIGNLRVYCLPVKFGWIKKIFIPLDFLLFPLEYVYMTIVSLFASKKIAQFIIAKDSFSYNQTRYKRLEGDYKIILYKGNNFVYKIMEYEGVKSAFLIDVFYKSAKNINDAVRYIMREEAMNTDVILYVGKLKFKGHGLLSVNNELSPKNFRMTGMILKKDVINEKLFYSIKNWDVNLSDYDLL